MKLSLGHPFARAASGTAHNAAERQSSSVDLSVSDNSIAAEYQSIILEQLSKAAVGDGLVGVSVHRSGHAANGLHTFVALIRLLRWDCDAGARLLLGVPLLQERVRRVVQNTWLVDVSRFGGLWLHPSSQLQHTQAVADLSALVMRLTNSELPVPLDNAGSSSMA